MRHTLTFTLFSTILIHFFSELHSEDLDQRIEYLELFSESLHYIQQNSVAPKPSRTLIEGAIRGMINSLDDSYAQLLTSKELEKINSQDNQSLFGIGIIAKPFQNILKILFVYPGSPAEKKGLKRGDEITIEKQPIQKGFRIDILAKGEKKSKSINLKKEEFAQKSVFFHVSGNIKILKILSFREQTPKEIKKLLQNFTADDSIVIDLRDNPGGLLNSVVETLEYFIHKGVVVHITPKEGKTRKTYYSSGAKTREFKKVFVLINENTASAAEIFAGAMRDRGAGKLLGQKTYGKGSVQSIKQLNQQYALKLTIAFYETPNGNNINKIGIPPDLSISSKSSFQDYSINDSVFQSVLDLL